MPITKVNTPDGSIMNIDHPEGATQEQILQYAASQYQGRAPTPEPPEPEYETTAAGQAFEFAKAVPRGFANSFLSAGEGLAELADAATDFVGLEDAIDSGEEIVLTRRLALTLLIEINGRPSSGKDWVRLQAFLPRLLESNCLVPLVKLRPLDDMAEQGLLPWVVVLGSRRVG